MATTSPSSPHPAQGKSWLNSQILWLRELPKALIAHQSILWAIAAVAIVIDQATKWWVEANIVLHTRIVPIEGYGHIFDFLHVKNPGAAFGTGQELGWLFTTIAFVVCGFILFYNSVILGLHRGFRIALGFIMGGALGNVIDRFRIGEVTDFIHFDFTPLVSESIAEMIPLLNFAIFNMADTFIFTGVLIMFWLMWKDVLPDDPWTEEEDAHKEFSDWQQTQVASKRSIASVPADNHAAYSYARTQNGAKKDGWSSPPSDLKKSASDGRLGLKIAVAFAVIGLIVTFVVMRKRRNRD